MSDFSVEPQRALIDVPLRLQLHDLAPQHTVAIRASFHDDYQQEWSSSASFAVDANGFVDLGVAKPLNGGYAMPDAMGLFWSMQLQGEISPYTSYVYDTTQSLSPLTVTLRAECDGECVAEVTVERLLVADGVERFDFREPDLVATLFLPAGGGSHPAALVVGGSNGGFGWSVQIAALLASRGCAAMAVAYFDWNGQFGLPRELVEIPLEYFSRAVEHLQASARVAGDNLTIIGTSKGGELALLLAATHPVIKRVVAYVPSAVVWEGAQMQPTSAQSSWRHQGKPLPFLRFSADEAFYATHDKTQLRSFHERALHDNEAVAQAAISVENINGPVLLISATEDSVWPSTQMSDLVLKRLQSQQRSFEDSHLILQGAGHALGVPYFPAGGFGEADIAANAAGEIRAWDSVLRFLHLEVRGEEVVPQQE